MGEKEEIPLITTEVSKVLNVKFLSLSMGDFFKKMASL